MVRRPQSSSGRTIIDNAKDIERLGWADLAAFRQGQVFAVEHGLCCALFDYCPTYFIAKSIYPKAFADIDLVAGLRRYHEQYLPVPFEGTWMARLTPYQHERRYRCCGRTVVGGQCAAHHRDRRVAALLAGSCAADPATGPAMLEPAFVVTVAINQDSDGHPVVLPLWAIRP